MSVRWEHLVSKGVTTVTVRSCVAVIKAMTWDPMATHAMVSAKDITPIVFDQLTMC